MHDASFNKYAENFQPVFIQRKLAVGAVDDPLEDEADDMADKVMRMPEQSFIQRKCAHCEEEEKQAQRKPLASFIQRKETAGNNTVSDNVSNKIQSTKGSGTALHEGTKNFMESRFGADFSNVKIHTGSYASQLSKELNAQAFTVGNNIYFNEGKFSPESDSGKHLLAHELTHTIQQGAGPGIIQRAAKEYATYISTQGPTDFLDGAKGYFANWGYPNIKNVSNVGEVVNDLAKADSNIEKFRIVSHANAFILDIGLLKDFSPIGFGERETQFTTEQAFNTFISGLSLITDATFTDWTTILLKDPGTLPLLQKIGITSVPAINSKEGILLSAILEETFVSMAELKDGGGKPDLPFKQAINTFNRQRIQSYSSSLKKAITAKKDQAIFEKAVQDLRSQAQGVLKAANKTAILDSQSEADTFGKQLTDDKNKFNPDISAAIREGTGGSSYLTNLVKAKTHINNNTHLEIRGCNAGDRPSLLTAIRNYFGNAPNLPSISAPDLFQYYYGLPFQTFTPNPKSVQALQDLWTNNSDFGKNYNLYHRLQNHELIVVVDDNKLDELVKRYGITLSLAEVKELNPEIKDPDNLSSGQIIWLKARTIAADASTTNLQDFCEKNFGSPYKWPQIWANNPSIKKPDKLLPGQQIEIASDALSKKTGYTSAELTQADFEKNIAAGEAYLFVDSDPKVIMNDAKRNASLAKWLGTKHFDYKDETETQLEKKLKAGGDRYFRSRYISFLSKSYPVPNDPILPDDPRYEGHIIKQP